MNQKVIKRIDPLSNERTITYYSLADAPIISKPSVTVVAPSNQDLAYAWITALVALGEPVVILDEHVDGLASCTRHYRGDIGDIEVWEAIAAQFQIKDIIFFPYYSARDPLVGLGYFRKNSVPVLTMLEFLKGYGSIPVFSVSYGETDHTAYAQSVRHYEEYFTALPFIPFLSIALSLREWYPQSAVDRLVRVWQKGAFRGLAERRVMISRKQLESGFDDIFEGK